MKERRQAPRLSEHDYSREGAYFVTMGTAGRACVLSEISEAGVTLTRLGRIVERHWTRIPEVAPAVRLDVFVIMPNHVHGVLIFHDEVAVPGDSALRSSKPTLNRVTGQFKSASARSINEFQRTAGRAFWQRGFHDRIVRDEEELSRIRAYIDENPLRWFLGARESKALPQNP